MITVVQWDAGDWIAIYEGDKLLHDGHSIGGVEMLRLLNITFKQIEVPDNDDAFVLYHEPSLSKLKASLESGDYRE